MRYAPLALALLLVGCSDFVDPRPPIPEEGTQPAPAPDLPTMSLKGPTSVTVGERPMYKAELLGTGVTYEFRIDDSTPVLTSSDRDQDRYLETRVVGQGQSELRVTAFDADGQAIAFAKRWIEARY